MTRSRVLLAGRIAITLAIFAALFSFLPLADVKDAMARTGWVLWFAVVVCFGVGHAVASLKWRGLVQATGTTLPTLDALRAHGAGLFANIWLPSIVGGDVVRAGWIARKHGLAVPAVAGLVDRVLDLVALVVLAGVGALLAGDAELGTAGNLLRGAGALLAVGIVAGLGVLRVLRPEYLPQKLRERGGRLLEITDALFARPGPAARALGLSLSVQFLFVALNATLGTAIGIDVGLAVWLLAWPLAKIAALAPVSLGGLGVREAALAALLLPFGVEGTLAVAQALVWQSVLFAFGGIAGLLAAVGGGRSAEAAA